MIYLKGFCLPDIGTEEGFFTELKRTCYTNYYPFGIFPSKRIPNGILFVLCIKKYM